MLFEWEWFQHQPRRRMNAHKSSAEKFDVHIVIRAQIRFQPSIKACDCLAITGSRHVIIVLLISILIMSEFQINKNYNNQIKRTFHYVIKYFSLAA
jgi:hypothetical protein